jgi:hypothetical protein
MGSRQHRAIDLAIGPGWGDHHQPFHAGNLGRHRVIKTVLG